MKLPFLILAIVVFVGAKQTSAGVFTAHTEVVNSTPGEFIPLDIGTPLVGYTDRLVWSEFPPILTEQPLHVWQVAGLASPGQAGPGPDPSPTYGIVSFDVTQSGPVWLAVTTRFGGGGNASGNWIPELTSRSELEAQGWTEIATDLKTFDVPTQADFDYLVFERESIAGESFTYRTEKYHPPLLLTTQFNPLPNVLFFDDFESETEPVDPRGFTADYDSFEKWDVVGSGVDLLARRFFPDQGLVVDLDHTSGSTLITKEEFSLPSGTYELSFDLGGPFGGTQQDTITVSLGSLLSDQVTVDRGAPFEHFERLITVNQSTSARLSFNDLGADSNGALLDNVNLSLISELPLLGDVNGDGALTVEDLDLLTEAVQTGKMESQYDVNNDGQVDILDRVSWVNDIKKTWFGDANLDGQFDSDDLIESFQAGEYADDILGNSTWSEGDFGGDGDFDPDDLLLAFESGAYLRGPMAAVRSVPEPRSLCLAVMSLGYIVALRLRLKWA